MKRIIIAGGGYAGVTLAKALDAEWDVVLIERKDRFYHNVGAMRAYTDESLYPQLLIPYDRLLRRGRVIQDEVAAVTQGHVEMQSGHNWGGDAIVVATGSGYGMPFKSEFRQSSDFLREAKEMSARLAAADRVAIVGAGPVGVELSGEISWRYPSKSVEILGSETQLLAEAGNPRLSARVETTLRDRGVTVSLGNPYAGEDLGADLVIRAYGAGRAVPCLGLLGQSSVDSCFRVPAMPGVFAIGDAAVAGEPALAFLARRQARYLARYLNDPRIGPYRPVRRVAMAIPLGPAEGAVQLPLPGLPVFGNWLTSHLKGKNLFIEKNWALMNQG